MKKQRIDYGGITGIDEWIIDRAHREGWSKVKLQEFLRNKQRKAERKTRNRNVNEGISRGMKPEKTQWHLPSFSSVLFQEEKTKLNKSNKYLKTMQKRIQKAVEQGDTKKAAHIGSILIQRSKVYTVFVLSKVSKGYFYELTEMSLWRYLNDYQKKVRNLEHSVTVKRVYLDKGKEKTGIPNGKLRPIGAPNLSAKMVFKAIEMVTREILEPIIGKYQHGFMRNRGTQTASMELIMKLRENKSIRVTEFDLKAFFNKVNVIRTCHYLTKMIGPMGQWIRAITTGNIPVIAKKDIQNESELVVEDFRTRVERPKGHKGWFQEWIDTTKIYRFGFTQGSPLSPLLCAYAIELSGLWKGADLIMFADDGLILSEEDVDIKKRMENESRKRIGLNLAYDKPYGESRLFKFLGLEYDLDNRLVSYRKKGTDTILMLNIDEASPKQLELLVKYAAYKYESKPKESVWKEEISEDEYKNLRGDMFRYVRNESKITGETKYQLRVDGRRTPLSMVAKVKDWIEYYAYRNARLFNKTPWDSYWRGVTEYLANVRREGHGWSRTWMSTVACIRVLEQLRIEGPLRKMAVYKIPEKLTPTQATIKTNRKLSYYYQGVEKWDVLSNYYVPEDRSRPY